MIKPEGSDISIAFYPVNGYFIMNAFQGNKIEAVLLDEVGTLCDEYDYQDWRAKLKKENK